jgi:hypothetical protein
LEKVFKLIFQANNGGQIDKNKIKGAVELKNYMNEILPTYDRNRVYVSDMKKLFSWYNLLHEYNLLSFDEETKDETKDDDTKTDTETHNS